MSITLRIVLSVAVLIYFILILYFLKKKAISLKYTLMWLMGGVCMAALVIYPRILTILRHLVGMESNMNLLFVAIIGFILIIMMALTSIVSGQSEKIKKLTQSIALLEKRVRELEKTNDSDNNTDTVEKSN